MRILPKTKAEYRTELLRRSEAGLFPCRNKDGECIYRGGILNNEQKMCAAGILIPDEAYSKDLEGDIVITMKPITNKFKPTKVTRFVKIPEGMTIVQIRKIQYLHDNFSGPWSHTCFSEQLDKILEAKE